MEEKTGIEYPTVMIGGKPYTVKFTTETMYDLGKAGVSFNPAYEQASNSWRCDFANLVDVLKVCIGFPGTARELAGMVYDIRDEITVVLIEAWGKVVLPSLKRRTEAARARAAAKRMEADPATQQPV